MDRNYSSITQSRTAIALANTWTAVTVLSGTQDAMLGLEDATQSWRFSTDNSINAATQGMPLGGGDKVKLDGTASATITVYVAAAIVPQVAILVSQRDP